MSTNIFLAASGILQESMDTSTFNEFVEFHSDLIADLIAEKHGDVDVTDEIIFEAACSALDDMGITEGIVSSIGGAVRRTAGRFKNAAKAFAQNPVPIAKVPTAATSTPGRVPAVRGSLSSVFKPHPDRAANKPVQQVPTIKPEVKAEVVKKTRTAAAAKRAMKSQLTPENHAALKDAGSKLISRSQKDGSVKHYIVDKSGARTHAATSRMSGGSWSHEKHD